MPSTSLFCTICGAANTIQASECFVCGQALATSPGAAARPGSYTLLKQRYLLLGQLGQGGFGAVYKAADAQLGERLLAIKEMSLNGSHGPEQEAIESFQREAMLLAGLMHPNLPRIYDHFIEDGRWYLVMDFIEGETLDDYLERAGKLPLEEVLSIGIQLCTVLAYLHTRQPSIIFRDLKPANIMRTPEGQLYLIDFGIARHFKPGQAKDTIAFGSPGYAAPEQYGKAQTTPGADIYSLGALLHYLLTGIDPSITPFCFDPLHLYGYTEPAELEALLVQMVEINVSKRPTRAVVVKEQLQLISKSLSALSSQKVPAASAESIAQVRTAPLQDLLQSIYRGHMNSVISLAWSPDSTRIVSGDKDHTIHIWNALGGERLALHSDPGSQLRWSNAIAWLPTGIYIAFYRESDEKGDLFWDKASGERILFYYERRKKVISVAWSPGGLYLAQGNNDRTIHVRNASTGETHFIYCGHRESLRLNRVNAVAWSPNELYIASGARVDGVHVWQITTGETIQTYVSHASELIALAWSPDGKYIASGGGDDTIQVWEVATRRRIFTYHGHSGSMGISTAAWSPDGMRIASAGSGNDTTVQVWDAFTGSNVFIYRAHTATVNTLAWSPDGKRIASAGEGQTVQVWNVL